MLSRMWVAQVGGTDTGTGYGGGRISFCPFGKDVLEFLWEFFLQYMYIANNLYTQK